MSDHQRHSHTIRTRSDAEGSTSALARRIAANFEIPGGHFAIAAQRIGRPAPNDEAAGSVRIRADEVFPAASLAKLPIAIELLRRADLRQFSLAERLDTAREPRVGGGGVLDYLDPGVRLTLGDLCTLMIIVSDNTAANFLLDLVGMGEVNETLSRLKLTHTTLARHFMDGAARAARRDNLTTADDMLALLTLIQGNALPGARRLYEMLSAQQLSTELAEGWLPADARLAHKDGALADTVHDAGILSGPGGSGVYCILTAEQSDIPAARVAIGQTLRLLWEAWELN
ncbi:MAG TPA: serine hydrolase [Ktedonobacterales bacterium]|nr:serine hydrolase [Ktedonobacterales bacterium]